MGELGTLEKHLTQNSQDDKDIEGCELAKIECSYCSSIIVRNNLLHHKNELCDKHPFSCEYCNDYQSNYEDVIHNHWPVCGCHPVRCPNECGAFPRRQNIDGHIQEECPLMVIECEFQYAGYEVKLPRRIRNMPDHLKDYFIERCLLLAVSHKRQQDKIKALEQKHQVEIKALGEEIDKLKMQTKKLMSHVQIFPIDFIVQNVKTLVRFIGLQNPSTPILKDIN